MADLTKLSKTGLTLLWSKITTLFVAKEAGKGLSTNDYDATAVAEVAKTAKISTEEVYLGIGWLLKEGKAKEENNNVTLA